MKRYIISQMGKAFSGDFFDICCIPYAHNDDRPAVTLISSMHCKHFDGMQEDMKKLLWRSCLEVCNITKEEFPYPFVGLEPPDAKESNGITELVIHHDISTSNYSKSHSNHKMCPFEDSHSMTSKLTQNWSESERRQWRHRIQEHIFVSTSIGLLIGMVLGGLLTTLWPNVRVTANPSVSHSISHYGASTNIPDDIPPVIKREYPPIKIAPSKSALIPQSPSNESGSMVK